MSIGSGISAQLGLAPETFTSAQITVTVTGTPTGGTFTLTVEGFTTAAIAYNATAAAVATALQTLPNINSATTLAATGGALPTTPAVITMSANAANRTIGAVSANSAGLTGGSTPTATPTISTQGSGYGTRQTPTRFLEFDTEALKLTMTPTVGTGLRATNRVDRVDRFVPNRKGAGGTVDFEFMNTGFGMVLKAMMGSLVVTTPSGATLTRLHTATLADLYAASYTFQVGRPDIYGNVRPFDYLGCKVSSWTLTGAIDALLKLQLTLDAQDESTSQTLASASYPAAQSQFSFVGCQVTLDGGNWDTTQIVVTASNGLDGARYVNRGSSLKKEPISNAMAKISGTIDFEFPSLYAQQKFASATAAGSLGAITATWTGAQIEATTPAYNYQLQVVLPFCRFDGDTPPVSGPAILKQTVPYTALWDGTTQPISLLYTTTDVAA